jgi:hypothetical protein
MIVRSRVYNDRLSKCEVARGSQCGQLQSMY